MVLEHIASGMYGAVVVEPRAGFPTKVDHVAVEFVIPENGSYIMVDHHFANASQGAMGLISTAARVDGTEIEHHNLPASATPTELEAAQGKLNVESKCVACHSIGQGRKLGPDMVGVAKRRTEDWLTRWLRAPDRMLESDPDAKTMLKEYNNLPRPKAVHCVDSMAVRVRTQGPGPSARKNRAPVGLRWSGRRDVLGHRT